MKSLARCVAAEHNSKDETELSVMNTIVDRGHCLESVGIRADLNHKLT